MAGIDMTEARKLVERREELDLEIFNGPLAAIPAIATHLSEKYGPEATLEAEYVYDYVQLLVKFKTPETDIEMARRLRTESRNKKARKAKKAKLEEKELKELERLKAKYPQP